MKTVSQLVNDALLMTAYSIYNKVNHSESFTNNL